MVWAYEIGQEIEASHGRIGTITAKTIVSAGHLGKEYPAYAVKSGRSRFVVEEDDIDKRILSWEEATCSNDMFSPV